jgi:hypothetical protein
MNLIILKYNRRGKNLWQILADFVADSVAESKKNLDYQGVVVSKGRCGRE